MLNRRDFLKGSVAGAACLPFIDAPTPVKPNWQPGLIPSLDKILEGRQYRLIACIGTSGSGKTSLAHEICLRYPSSCLVDDEFPEPLYSCGVHNWSSLHPIHTRFLVSRRFRSEIPIIFTVPANRSFRGFECYVALPAPKRWFMMTDLILVTKKTDFSPIEVTVLKDRYPTRIKDAFRVRPVLGKGLVEV